MIGSSARASQEQQLMLPTGDASLVGDLIVPREACGIVLFAHGSGSSRSSPRNRQVARTLQAAGLATLLCDLLTPAEARDDEGTGAWRFNIPFLAGRLGAVAELVSGGIAGERLPLGLFGASTGAAAALVAAAQHPDLVRAIVSRGGRPDLAGQMLRHVEAPTLLIVGGRDDIVIDLNSTALDQLTCVKEMRIVPRATHLFEEPGALEQVAQLAQEWFLRYLPTVPAVASIL